MKTKHGLSASPFYKVYMSMQGRCQQRSGHSSWRRYGAKGIRCLWKNFEEFKNDMYLSYVDHVERYGREQTTLERINSKGNYCKKNCRWATRKEQQRNISSNTFIDFNGEHKTIAEWSEKLGWPRNILYGRFAYGWSVERALTTPVVPRTRNPH